MITVESRIPPWVTPETCIKCKGARNLCGLGYCPILESAKDSFPKIEFHGKEMYGSSPPSIFVGRYGYPKVYAGPVLPPFVSNDVELLGISSRLYGMGITEIIGKRSALYRTSSIYDVRRPRDKGGILEATQMLAMAERPVDLEVKLTKEIKGSPTLDFFHAPIGPRTEAEKARITENPVVPRKVDALVDDTDARAVDALFELHRSGIEVDRAQNLLAAGLLGRARSRRMVPTRWSITAVDDMLGKRLMEYVRYRQEIGEFELYENTYLGNHMNILLIPEEWGFEMVEMWMKGSYWSPQDVTLSDWEPFEGRKTYAENITGGYYAARLAVLEHLHRRRRSAKVVIYREISPEYWAPLGVWVVRETARKAMEKEPMKFSSLDEVVSEITKRVHNKEWAKHSHIIMEMKVQRRITDYL